MSELTTEQVNLMSTNKNGQSLKIVLNELLEETTENGVTNKQLLAEKMLALALGGHEGMIKLIWTHANDVSYKSGVDWERLEAQW